MTLPGARCTFGGNPIAAEAAAGRQARPAALAAIAPGRLYLDAVRASASSLRPGSSALLLISSRLA